MKKLCILAIVLICGISLYAQYESYYDDDYFKMYTKEWEEPRDAIAGIKNDNNNISHKWMNGYYDNYLRQPPDPELTKKINNLINQTQGSVRFETSSSSYNNPSINQVSSQQAQQIKKAKRDAEHRAWLEQKQRAKAIAAERRRMEEQRKQQIRYNRFLDSELQRTASRAIQQQAKIEFRATEGKDFMNSYQPAGTEKIKSEYIPSSIASTYSVAAIVAKSGNKPIALEGNEHYKSDSKWDEMLKGTSMEKKITDYVNASTDLTELYIKYPQDLTQLLHNEFKNVSGFNLDAIMQKLPSERTEAEKQALIDYQTYREKMMYQMANNIDGIIDNSKEQKIIDAAILANHVYEPNKVILGTHYKKIDLDSISKGNPMAGVANSIIKCNQTKNTTGFHAEIYFNKNTNTYTISIAGTDDSEDWLNNNLPNMLGGDVPQYNLAIDIAKAINNIPEAERENLNIQVVGHSLGGGVASVIGLVTGLETRTFNAARVSKDYLETNGINSLNASNITAYHTSTDILTKVQRSAGTPAIGVSVNLGDPSTIGEKAIAIIDVAKRGVKVGSVTGGYVTGAMIGGTVGATVDGTVGSIVGGTIGGTIGSTIGGPVAGTVGGILLGESVEGHRMGPIVRSIKQSNMQKAGTEWDRLRHIRKELLKAANTPEIQTQETILIKK